MKKFLMLLCAIMLVFGMVGAANAVPVQFSGNGHYYEVMTTYEANYWGGTSEINFNGTWNQALIYSDDYSYLGEIAYFATITSQEENDFVASLVADTGIDAWLGGNDRDNEGTWIWAATGKRLPIAIGRPVNQTTIGGRILLRCTSMVHGTTLMVGIETEHTWSSTMVPLLSPNPPPFC